MNDECGMMSDKRPDILKRTKLFSLRIIRLYGALPKKTEAQVIGKQLLRSGTSVGAHHSSLTIAGLKNTYGLTIIPEKSPPLFSHSSTWAAVGRTSSPFSSQILIWATRSSATSIATSTRSSFSATRKRISCFWCGLNQDQLTVPTSSLSLVANKLSFCTFTLH